MKTAKMFQQNQKIVLKKKTFIHLFQWICVSYLKLFRKLIFSQNDYEPPSMRTLVEATTNREIKNVKKQLKAKKHLSKMFQKNKKQKFKNFSNEALRMAWIVIKKKWYVSSKFLKKKCFIDIMTIRMQTILIKSEF